MSVPVTRHIGEQDYTFQRLTPADMFKLASVEFERERTNLLKDLNDAQATSDQRLKHLTDLRSNYEIGMSVAVMALTTRGALEILRMSASKVGSTQCVPDSLDFGHEDLRNTALELIGENPEQFIKSLRQASRTDEENPTTAETHPQ